MLERNDHPTTSKNPFSKKNGVNGHSQIDQSASSLTNNTENNINGNLKSLVKFENKNGHQNDGNLADNLQASPSVLDKQKRQLQEQNANAFGGVSKEINLSENDDNGAGKFVSKNVIRQKQSNITQISASKSLTNPNLPKTQTQSVELVDNVSPKTSSIALDVGNETIDAGLEIFDTLKEAFLPTSYADEQKRQKKRKAVDKDNKLLSNDGWLVRNGHSMTYIGLFLFTFTLYFRPYEWIPGFSGFTSLALIFALATIIIYIPSQLATEGSLTILTTEVKCLLLIAPPELYHPEISNE